MRPDDVALTGLPRSGTNLTCTLLNRIPDTVALAEPMDVERLPSYGSRAAAAAAVAQFAAEQRRTLLERAVAITRHRDGVIRDNFFGDERDEQGLRRSVSSRGEIGFDKPLSVRFRLVIKHPAAFTALLPELREVMPCFALVRNPAAVLASWNANRMAVHDGQAPAAEGLDPTLAACLQQIEDRFDRQLALLDWFFRRYLDYLGPEGILRYEDVIASRGRVLGRIAPGGERLDEPLLDRNRNPMYEWKELQPLYERLLASPGAWWQLYDRAEVAALTGLPVTG